MVLYCVDVSAEPGSYDVDVLDISADRPRLAIYELCSTPRVASRYAAEARRNSAMAMPSVGHSVI